MRRPLLLLAAACLLGGPLGAQQRPLALEDYYTVASVGSPTISPDGAWVAYTVSRPVEETNESEVEVWLVATDGGSEPRPVRPGGRDASDPEWTRDGLLRVATADEGRWLVAPGDPDADPVQDGGPAVEGVPSPDGRWVAHTQEVPREAPAPPEMTAFERRHQERFEGDDFDWYPFRRDGQSFPLPDARLGAAEEVAVQPAEGGEPRTLTGLGIRAGDLTWSPEGDAILFTADEAVLDELAYGRTDLFLVTMDGALSRLTNDGYVYRSAAFSPDGRWISYTRSVGTDMIVEGTMTHGGSRDVWIRPREGGEPVNLTADWDLDPGTPRWTPDGRHLWWTAQAKGAEHLFRVEVASGAVEQVTTGERRIYAVEADRAFRRMAYMVGTFDGPPEVWVANTDGSGERRLTDVHRAFREEVALSTRPAERVRWESYDGTPVEGFLLFPHGYDPGAGPYPLIVMNHGGPHSSIRPGFSFKNALFAAHGYFVFLPNFRGSTGYGDAFKWGSWGAWGTKDGEDVMSGVDHLLARFPVDRNRVGTTGHSYGGIMTNWLITRYPDRFRAAVSGAGASNWTSNYALSDVARTKEMEFFGRPWEPRAREVMIRQSAYLNSAGVQAATLFVHGDEDYRVPIEGAIQLYTSLKKQRVPTRMIIYRGMAHGIRGHWNQIHRMMHELRWWETRLKPRSPPRADASR